MFRGGAMRKISAHWGWTIVCAHKNVHAVAVFMLQVHVGAARLAVRHRVGKRTEPQAK